jgi:hypothetical protein
MEETMILTFSDISKIITEKYKNRPLTPSDPAPIMIPCNIDGPLNISKGVIMCDLCGSIIRKNYLQNHRKSGACSRAAEKIEIKSNKYSGPYIQINNKCILDSDI